MLGAHQATLLLNLPLLLLSGVPPSAHHHMQKHIGPHCPQQAKGLVTSQVASVSGYLWLLCDLCHLSACSQASVEPMFKVPLKRCYLTTGLLVVNHTVETLDPSREHRPLFISGARIYLKIAHSTRHPPASGLV